MVEFSYVPGERERRLEHDAARIAALRWWWMPGGLLMIVAAVLIALAAAGGARGAAGGLAVAVIVAGGTLLVVPYYFFERDFRAILRRPARERRVTMSDAGVRVDSAGMVVELDWSRIRTIAERGDRWRFVWDSGGGLAVPKSAVLDADRVEFARLAKLAGTLPSPLDG